ncbi:ribbon-helix-helix domain-containing protein [Rhizobium sp. CB3090]|uniref:ribbon-helix-helix domain-containing protein n=1 Tax=Rhizobium sp. CB3090 TaxID=3039156 RepID=UPI0024B18230|nr:CopG family transcriptional regulator [Rhizobium sp. CB3090]WFU10716.1 ribbon-helix-helix domain-containing protein [Rhizobium sp. CB3090]
MRTTLAIDDDVLAAAKAMAEQQRRSVGDVISDLARRSLSRPQMGAERNGIPLLVPKSSTPPITLEIVNKLRDELP